MQNHYYDNNHVLRPYTHSLAASPGSVAPANALRGEKPEIIPGFWPCEDGGAFVQVEDHRERKAGGQMPESVAQDATEYWQPGDTWETGARTMTDVGPLPEGAIAERPEKPADAVLADTIAEYEANIQARLDGFASTLTYDGIMSACTYATSGVEMYRIEGQYCGDSRDATWARAYELLSAILPTVQAGGDIPVWEAIEAELPVLEWPEGSRGYGAS